MPSPSPCPAPKAFTYMQTHLHTDEKFHRQVVISIYRSQISNHHTSFSSGNFKFLKISMTFQVTVISLGFPQSSLWNLFQFLIIVSMLLPHYTKDIRPQPSLTKMAAFSPLSHMLHFLKIYSQHNCNSCLNT